MNKGGDHKCKINQGRMYIVLTRQNIGHITTPPLSCNEDSNLLSHDVKGRTHTREKNPFDRRYTTLCDISPSTPFLDFGNQLSSFLDSGQMLTHSLDSPPERSGST